MVYKPIKFKDIEGNVYYIYPMALQSIHHNYSYGSEYSDYNTAKTIVNFGHAYLDSLYLEESPEEVVEMIDREINSTTSTT